jgi:hypothetical protein
MIKRVIIVAVFALAAVNVGPVRAAEDTADKVADVVLSQIEKRVIRDYYRKQREERQKAGKADKPRNGKGNHAKRGNGKSNRLPPGLAKRDTLPPGLARQIEKNGTLPPGLAKRDLPADLESRLPRRRGGQRRIVVDDDVVLIEDATDRILDVLEDVVTGGGS